MSLVGRYTTPTHIFTVPFDTGTISMMAVIYKQGGNVVLVKDLEDCTLGDKTVSCTLTEEETSLFKPNPQVQIQLRVGIGNARLNSNILNVSVADVLKDGLLDDIAGGDTKLFFRLHSNPLKTSFKPLLHLRHLLLQLHSAAWLA